MTIKCPDCTRDTAWCPTCQNRRQLILGEGERKRGLAPRQLYARGGFIAAVLLVIVLIVAGVVLLR